MRASSDICASLPVRQLDLKPVIGQNLVGLVAVGTPEGKWSPAAALEYVQQMPNPYRQAVSLMVLLNGNCGVSPVQVFEVARAIIDQRVRFQALEAVAPQLPPP